MAVKSGTIRASLTAPTGTPTSRNWRQYAYRISKSGRDQPAHARIRARTESALGVLEV